MRRNYKLIKNNTVKYFTRLNIGRQLLLGYLPLVVLIVFISLYVLYNIGGVNRISKDIVENDIEIIASADKLVNSLLGQESYGQRYIILESEEMLGFFWQRSAEYVKILDTIGRLQGKPEAKIASLRSLHRQYNFIYETFFSESERTKRVFKLKYEVEAKAVFKKMLKVAGAMSTDTKKRRDTRMRQIGVVGYRTFWITAVLAVIGILSGVLAAVLITRNISTSVKKLKVATDQISEGNFTHVLRLNRNDELGDLADSFSVMAKRLSRWEEMYLDASPLTRLPGGIAIDNVLKKRLEAGRTLAFCLIDLDNFKSFNDKYGYAMGNIVIKSTAKIIETSVVQNGDEDDFVGHIGGDDFAVIASPERVVNICTYIVEEFDKTIPGFYEETDRNRGYIDGKTRQGDAVNFPIMSVSIAIVTNDSSRNMNHIEIGEIAAELKEHAKLVPGSTYLSDRRSGDGSF